MTNLYPVCFQPVYKSYIWGGTKIASLFHRRDAPEKVAESWEISDRTDGMSIVANGIWKGLSLHELMEKLGPALIGTDRQDVVFPLLIKLIDANENLSVQVHPDDMSAKLLDAEPKTEAWYFLETAEQAAVYAGLKPRIDRKAFEKALEKEAVLDILQKIPVAKEDVISVPGGRVHAILSGCLLLEIQQNSNTTYRIYDWGRGGARPLHIGEALQAIRWEDHSGARIAPKILQREKGLQVDLLLKTPYFELQKIMIEKVWHSVPVASSFQVFFALEGSALLVADGNEEEMVLGRTYLVPAACKEVVVKSFSGSATFLRITL